MPRTVVIVNPQSGGGRMRRSWKQQRDRLLQTYGPFDELVTSAPGEATTLTRAALRGEDGNPQGPAGIVLALGGDGTINEVVNGFFEAGVAIAPEACLGVLPGGSGGDFRRSIESPVDLAHAGAWLRDAAPAAIDVGRLSCQGPNGQSVERYFVNIAAFGIAGLIDQYVNRSRKLLGGPLTFAMSTLRAGLRYQNPEVRLCLDGGEPITTRIYNVAIANGRYFGGGMKVAPNAQLSDGLLDVVVIGDMGFGDLVTSGLDIYSGRHLRHQKVSVYRARLVEAEPVRPEDEVLIDADGEAPGRLPARFEVLPGSLRLLRPR